MSNTSISVVIATYNGEKYLQAQLDSILQQTMLPAEIIVCDDCSTDGTVKILQKYKEQGVLQYYINSSTLGVVENVKKAVTFAQEGNYIALCDQDDIWMPHKLKTLHDVLKEEEEKNQNISIPCIVYSDIILVDEHENVINSSFWNELSHDKHTHCLHTLLFGNFVTGCSVMFNAATKKHFNAIPKHILHDVWLAFVGYTLGRIKTIKMPLVYYRQHANNVNYNKENIKKTKWQARIKRFNNIFTKNNYLEEEYFIAETFLLQYSNEISISKQKTIRQFLFTRKLPYFFKEIALKIFFWGKWK